MKNYILVAYIFDRFLPFLPYSTLLYLYGSVKIKCTLCQGHYDFSFSDFYFIFVCCVEASK
ncbi:hypothetical protein DWX81_09980 [Roseburia inulinivorans]|nr:hypothetical protein DWX81_09980 [Roseburia inulinivorans]